MGLILLRMIAPCILAHLTCGKSKLPVTIFVSPLFCNLPLVFVVDRKIVSVEEGSEIVLKFVETAKDGAYGDMTWYKGSIDVDKRIATALHSTNFRAVYFNEYCSGRDQCRTTDKAALDTITGEMTIHNVAPIDDDYYYYAYSTINSGIQDIGKKYEIKVEVYGKFVQ